MGTLTPPIDNAWEMLSEILPPDQLDHLATLILEALQQDNWGTVKVEIRDHHLHALSVETSQLVRRSGSNLLEQK